LKLGGGIALLIVRDVIAFFILQLWEGGGKLFPVGPHLSAYRPDNGIFYQLLKAFFTTGALVVAVGGIVNTSVALPAYPGPGLILTLHQYRSVFGVVLAVDVGFIPGFKFFKVFSDGMISVNNICSKRAGTMFFKLCAYEIHKCFGISKAKTRRMDGQKSLSVFHKVE